MQNRCVVPNCDGGGSDPEPLFRFPSDPERSKKWVETCQRDDLLDKSPGQLYRYYRLCGKHFEASLIDKETQGAVLKEDSVPTIFEMPNQQKNVQGKRTKVMTTEETSPKGRKRLKKSQTEPAKDGIQALSQEEEYKEYLKSLFEVLVLLGEQSIPPTGPGVNNLDGSSNFMALLEYRITCSDDALKKRYDEDKEYCTQERFNQLMEVCEKYIHSKLVEEVKLNGFFSLLTDDVVQISGEWFLPVFVRYVDQSNIQRERFAGFLPFEGDGGELAEKLISEITDKWGLDMKQCRGQAHSNCGTHYSKIKTFAAKLVEKHPTAVISLRSTQAFTVSLANSMVLSGVQLVMSTFKKIDSFFTQSHLLQLELEHAITIFFPDNEEKAKELKEICKTSWTKQNSVFEVALELLEAILLCVDSIQDNEDMRWSDQVTHDALEISKGLTDFEFVMALIVLKNVMTLTQAFGKNVQGKATEVHFATGSLKGVLHTLKEVSDNMDVYHEFWNDEAVNLAAAMDVPVKVPRAYLRKHQLDAVAVRPESYYKEHLSIPVVNHIISELNEIFNENHLKALRGLSLVPSVIDENKSNEPEEESLQMFKNDIPNAGSPSAELHCWWVKWSKRGKGEFLPTSLQEALQLADIKFFPNMLAILRLIAVIPTVPMEGVGNVAYKHFQSYMENTPDKFKSKSLALLNMNCDVEFDLDELVELYMKMFPEKDDVGVKCEATV